AEVNEEELHEERRPPEDLYVDDREPPERERPVPPRDREQDAEAHGPRERGERDEERLQGAHRERREVLRVVLDALEEGPRLDRAHPVVEAGPRRRAHLRVVEEVRRVGVPEAPLLVDRAELALLPQLVERGIDRVAEARLPPGARDDVAELAEGLVEHPHAGLE